MTAVLDTKVTFNLSSSFFFRCKPGMFVTCFQSVSCTWCFNWLFFLAQPCLPLENSLNFQTKPNARETLQSLRIRQYYIPEKAFDFRRNCANTRQPHPTQPSRCPSAASCRRRLSFSVTSSSLSTQVSGCLILAFTDHNQRAPKRIKLSEGNLSGQESKEKKNSLSSPHWFP